MKARPITSVDELVYYNLEFPVFRPVILFDRSWWQKILEGLKWLAEQRQRRKAARR